MVISRTPYRISFFGGGTDYPGWYRSNGGAVLATTINKYCYLTCRYLPPFFEHRFRVVYSQIESSQLVDEIKHPSVREVLRYLNIERGLEIHHDGDLPARSGTGSSSSFTVGLLHALYALKGKMPSKHELMTESIYLEQERLKETVGSQDQTLAAYGGLNHIRFHQNDTISVSPMTLHPDRIDELDSHLMLFYTGIKRTASNIAQSYVQDVERNAVQLERLGEFVTEGISVLTSGDNIGRFGKLLHEAWLVKKDLGKQISNPLIEDLYNQAISAGAIGGKITGAGGGGFMLLFVHPGDQEKVRERLSKFIHVPFKFDFSGSNIIFYDPQEDYSAVEAIRETQQIEAFQELASKK
jgi:D-glycero-alpha-D-manno-heptose-7-phosphate kinase